MSIDTHLKYLKLYIYIWTLMLTRINIVWFSHTMRKRQNAMRIPIIFSWRIPLFSLSGTSRPVFQSGILVLVGIGILMPMGIRILYSTAQYCIYIYGALWGPRVPIYGALWGPRVPGPWAPGPRVPGPRVPGLRVPGPRVPGLRVLGPGGSQGGAPGGPR